MRPDRFQEVTSRYPELRVAVVGDFCLDRYLEIDPGRAETSIETGLPVHNVIKVRAQPGAAGTIVNNLVALGIGEIHPVGFCGEDGEGFELRRALAALPGVNLEHFLTTPHRRTFTYCKPLLLRPGQPPEELSRLDSKNWSPTPPSLAGRITESARHLSHRVDAIIVMDQVDTADTGVVNRGLLDVLAGLAENLPVLADSRRGLQDYPPLIFKMNAVELATLLPEEHAPDVERVRRSAQALARRNRQPVFVTMAEQGLVGALPDGTVEQVPALPVRGDIDVVGAGDAVTANLAAALAAGASLREALELAALASSIVIHQLGTTGTATLPAMAGLLSP